MSAVYNKRSDRKPRSGVQVVIVLFATVFLACASESHVVKSDHKHNVLADHYYNEKKYDKAKHELLMIIKKNPDDVESNFRLGVIYANEGFIEKSRTAFEKVLSIDPEHSKAYFNLGVLFAKGNSADHIKKSIEYFDDFLEREPNAKQRQKIEKWKAQHIRTTQK